MSSWQIVVTGEGTEGRKITIDGEASESEAKKVSFKVLNRSEKVVDQFYILYDPKAFENREHFHDGEEVYQDNEGIVFKVYSKYGTISHLCYEKMTGKVSLMPNGEYEKVFDVFVYGSSENDDYFCHLIDSFGNVKKVLYEDKPMGCWRSSDDLKIYYCFTNQEVKTLDIYDDEIEWEIWCYDPDYCKTSFVTAFESNIRYYRDAFTSYVYYL